MAETNENLLEQLDLNEEVEYKESTKSNQSNKIGYKDRKIDNRLKKCEAMIKKDENINRLNDDSQVSNYLLLKKHIKISGLKVTSNRIFLS